MYTTYVAQLQQVSFDLIAVVGPSPEISGFGRGITLKKFNNLSAAYLSLHITAIFGQDP